MDESRHMPSRWWSVSAMFSGGMGKAVKTAISSRLSAFDAAKNAARRNPMDAWTGFA
jgi:hypothetical protein